MGIIIYIFIYFTLFFILYSIELRPYKATDVGRATYNGITKFIKKKLYKLLQYKNTIHAIIQQLET